MNSPREPDLGGIARASSARARVELHAARGRFAPQGSKSRRRQETTLTSATTDGTSPGAGSAHFVIASRVDAVPPLARARSADARLESALAFDRRASFAHVRRFRARIRSRVAAPRHPPPGAVLVRTLPAQLDAPRGAPPRDGRRGDAHPGELPRPPRAPRPRGRGPARLRGGGAPRRSEALREVSANAPAAASSLATSKASSRARRTPSLVLARRAAAATDRTPASARPRPAGPRATSVLAPESTERGSSRRPHGARVGARRAGATAATPPPHAPATPPPPDGTRERSGGGRILS